MFGFRKWQEYVEMVQRVRRVMKTWLFTYVPLCFAGWKGILTAKHARIAEMHKIAEHRAKIGGLLVRYKRWVIYTMKERRKKGMLRRILEIPQFGMWITYTKAAHRRRRMFRVMWNFTKVCYHILNSSNPHLTLLDCFGSCGILSRFDIIP